MSSTKPGPGGNGSLLLTPVELIDRIAALVPPPRLQRHCYSGCWRERPHTGNFCGDTERPVLPASRPIIESAAPSSVAPRPPLSSERCPHRMSLLCGRLGPQFWLAPNPYQTYGTAYGTHSMRRTKPTLIYRRTTNFRAVQLVEAGLRYSDASVIEARLKRIEEQLANTLTRLDELETVPFNQMADWGTNGRITRLVSLKAANALGLTNPQSLLSRADEVIR